MGSRATANSLMQRTTSTIDASPFRKESELMRTVADQFAETLAAGGVKRIYGIVGDSLNGLTDALRRQGKIEWVHVRHEEVAAFAAGAEAPNLAGRQWSRDKSSRRKSRWPTVLQAASHPHYHPSTHARRSTGSRSPVSGPPGSAGCWTAWILSSMRLSLGRR